MLFEWLTYVRATRAVVPIFRLIYFSCALASRQEYYRSTSVKLCSLNYTRLFGVFEECITRRCWAEAKLPARVVYSYHAGSCRLVGCSFPDDCAVALDKSTEDED